MDNIWPAFIFNKRSRPSPNQYLVLSACTTLSQAASTWYQKTTKNVYLSFFTQLIYWGRQGARDGNEILIRILSKKNSWSSSGLAFRDPLLESLDKTIQEQCAIGTKQHNINNRNAENKNRLKRITCNSKKLFTN